MILTAAVVALVLLVGLVGAVQRLSQRSEPLVTATPEEYEDPVEFQDPIGDEGRWQVHLARTADVQIRWEMPLAFGIDGPRALLNIPSPAIGTFWVNTEPDAPLRYGGTLIQNVDALGVDPAAQGIAALTMLNTASTIDVGDAVPGESGTVEIPFSEVYDGRVYLGNAYVANGDVFVVEVGYLEDRPDLSDHAGIILDEMMWSVSFEPL